MSELNELVPMPDDVKFRVQQVILPITASTTHGEWHPVGTGFVICTLGRIALLLSAAHNFEEIKKVDQPYDHHHPSTQNEFRPTRSLGTQLRKTYMHAIYRTLDGASHVATIQNVYVNTPGDLAVCTVYMGESIPSSIKFDSKLAIDTTPPKNGTPIIAAGYSSMRGDSHVDYEANVATARHHQTLEWRHSHITQVYSPYGPRNQPWPSFQSNVPFDSGMSGGPIIDNQYGDLMVAVGVISSDSTGETSNAGVSSGLDAIASMIWPSMGIEIKEAEIEGTKRSVKLLELEAGKFLDDKGRASEHISFVRGNTPDNFRMIWR